MVSQELETWPLRSSLKTSGEVLRSMHWHDLVAVRNKLQGGKKRGFENRLFDLFCFARIREYICEVYRCKACMRNAWMHACIHPCMYRTLAIDHSLTPHVGIW